MAVNGKGGLFRSSSSALTLPIVVGWAVDTLLEIQLCNVVVAPIMPDVGDGYCCLIWRVMATEKVVNWWAVMQGLGGGI